MRATCGNASHIITGKVVQSAAGVAVAEWHSDRLYEPVTDERTATPLVPGVLANLLVYDEVPSDTSTGHVAANAKKSLQDMASWTRQPNVKVI